MSVLYFFESIRCPALDAFFSIVTHFGEETFFIVFALLFLWCIDKKEGYYLLSIGFIGTVLSLFLKVIYRIPRPWVKDPDFTIVESARAEAKGYSFPSSHTQSAVGALGGAARWNKNIIFRIICIVFCLLVPVSRLYLGVHTPLDVGVSVVIAALLIFGLYPLISKLFESKKTMRILFSLMVALSLGLILFVSLYSFPSPTEEDRENLTTITEYGYKMLGCTVGIFAAFEIESRFIRFDTAAALPAQVIKFVLGIVPLLAIKSGLEAPLSALFGGHFAAESVRYFLIVIYLGCVWPLSFKWFSRLFRGKK